MKKFIIICLAAAIIAISSCTGADKTNRNSDTGAAKGSEESVDSAQGIQSPSPSATTPGSSDTSNIGKSPAEPMGDTVKKTP